MNGTSSNPLLTLGAGLRPVYPLAAVLALVACGGHSSSSSSSGSYTIGGTISGLTSGSVVLILNDSTTVTVASSATTWTFPDPLASGSSYSVAVLEQPTGGLCYVTGAPNGTAITADISDVTVTCGFYGEWTWEGGPDSVNASGVYGTQGAASATNVPGSRYDSSSWTDSSGNLWLFGGYGYDSTGALGALNDLWQYSPSSAQWTWVSGGSGDNATGVYGTAGTPAATNLPGARQAASTWTDPSGNRWLFGGYGYASTGAAGKLNDLWEYSASTAQWAWVSGSTGLNATGSYGTQGAAAAGDMPGARYASNSWTDSSGNLWLFGGYGYDSTGALGVLNDLWQYSPTTGLWIWFAGGNTDNASGVYGTQGNAAVGNLPGARQGASSWIDTSGNLWLFGGYGYNSAGVLGDLSDLWQYSPSSGLWTWVNGGNTVNATGVYGTQGTAAATNLPGARQAANSWVDSSGNLWLFGGSGYGSSGGSNVLNDVWRYSPSTAMWTWISGDNGGGASGVYSTQGTSSASSVPGARQAASSWFDSSSGSLWLFGGVGEGSGANGYLGDLWQFVPPQ